MTAHDPRVTLTEAERDALEAACLEGLVLTEHGYRYRPATGADHVTQLLADLIAARLAPIRALADEWQQAGDALAPEDDWGESVEQTIRADFLREKAHALRAALDAPVSASQDHDGAEGQGEGYCGPGVCNHEPVHNHPPYRPLCPERCVDGLLRGACLNDDGSPR